MNTATIIEARMTSSRLPGKVLKPIMGRPALELLVERLRRCRRVDQVIVATTSNVTDDPIERLCEGLGIGCFRGSEHDVLDRVLRTARTFGVDLIVEITADCPLMDPATVDKLIEAYRAEPAGYVSLGFKGTYPIGLGVSAFATATLQEVDSLTRDPADREHVSLYIYEHPERYTVRALTSDVPERYWSMRLTLDTAEDLDVIRKIYDALYPGNPAFTQWDVFAFMEQHPDLQQVNRHIQPKSVR